MDEFQRYRTSEIFSFLADFVDYFKFLPEEKLVAIFEKIFGIDVTVLSIE